MATNNGTAVRGGFAAWKYDGAKILSGGGGAAALVTSHYQSPQFLFATNGQPAPPCQQQMGGMLDDLLWPVTVGLRTFSIACFNPAAAMTPYPYIQVLAEPLLGLGTPLMVQAAVLGWQTLEVSFTALVTGAVRVRRVVPCSFGWCFWDNIVLT